MKTGEVTFAEIPSSKQGMKVVFANLVVLFVGFSIPGGMALGSTLKLCTVEPMNLGYGLQSELTKFEIASSGLGPIAKVTMNGRTVVYDADVVEERVRPNLQPSHGESLANDLNLAESLIVYSMQVMADPAYLGEATVGFDLSKVRFTTLYAIVGSYTIVEAYDANKDLLGTFVVGYLIAPCK